MNEIVLILDTIFLIEEYEKKFVSLKSKNKLGFLKKRDFKKLKKQGYIKDVDNEMKAKFLLDYDE